MKERLKDEKRRIADYAIVYIEAPMHAEIERFIYTGRKTIYINLSARPDAKLVKLMQ